MSVTFSMTTWKVWTLTRWLFQPSLSGSTSRTRDRLRQERKPSPCSHWWSLPRVRNPVVHIMAWWLFPVGLLRTKLITLCCSSKDIEWVSYSSLRLSAALVSPGELRIQPGVGMEPDIRIKVEGAATSFCVTFVDFTETWSWARGKPSPAYFVFHRGNSPGKWSGWYGCSLAAQSTRAHSPSWVFQVLPAEAKEGPSAWLGRPGFRPVIPALTVMPVLASPPVPS